jgi:hypothetical protein
MGNTNLDQLSEHHMSKKQTYTPKIDESPTEAPKPRAPEKVNLTNKAGGRATPLAKDVEAWIKKGWFRA